VEEVLRLLDGELDIVVFADDFAIGNVFEFIAAGA